MPRKAKSRGNARGALGSHAPPQLWPKRAERKNRKRRGWYRPKTARQANSSAMRSGSGKRLQTPLLPQCFLWGGERSAAGRMGRLATPV